MPHSGLYFGGYYDRRKSKIPGADESRHRPKNQGSYAPRQLPEDVSEFLPPIILHALRGTIQCSENRISRLLFKLTVEISMMMHVLAMGLEVNTDQLDALRWQCVQEVKKTNGSITFKETLQQNQGEI